MEYSETQTIKMLLCVAERWEQDNEPINRLIALTKIQSKIARMISEETSDLFLWLDKPKKSISSEDFAALMKIASSE